MKTDHPQPSLSRRALFKEGAIAAVSAATAASSLAAYSSANGQSLPEREPLTVQTTEGPFFLAGMANREDITEGFAGIPLELGFRVVDEQGKPQHGAIVDVWHCDANGVYSGFAGQGDDLSISAVGKSFLRGRQTTNASGDVLFRTIYPGWYAGRTTHIHFKVSYDTRTALTTQFFLPDSLSEFLYTQLPQYKREKLRDVLNSTDGIALSAGTTVLGSVKEFSNRYHAALRIVVDPEANPRVRRPPPPGTPRPMGGPPPGFGGMPAPLKTPLGAARIKALVPS